MRLGGLRRSVDERTVAVAYAIQVFLLTLGCHREVIGGAIHGWAAVAFLLGPIILWVSAVLAVRNAWRGR
jgi:TM2 domain-containing membrane protein YozV